MNTNNNIVIIYVDTKVDYLNEIYKSSMAMAQS